MNIANMSSADRLKAGILIGLTVVALFVVTHTVLAIVAPKGNAKTSAKSTAAATHSSGAAVASASTGTAAPAGVPGLDFPVAQAKNQSASHVADAPELSQDLHDPFVPMDPADRKQHPGAGAAPAVAPDRRPTIQPEIQVGPLPSAGFGGGPRTVLQGMGPAPMAVPPPPEPEIHLIGIVCGDPSVATLQVDGRTLLARPGDGVARGYRMVEVGAEGILLKSKSRVYRLRVGCAINEAAKKATAP